MASGSWLLSMTRYSNPNSGQKLVAEDNFTAFVTEAQGKMLADAANSAFNNVVTVVVGPGGEFYEGKYTPPN